MSYTIYMMGFRKNGFSADEQKQFDEHVQKWSSDWKKIPYHPLDARESSFSDIAQTFEEEKIREDDTPIVVYQELTLEDAQEKDRFLKALKEIRELFPTIDFEAQDESGKI